ncbi:peptide ABC transporter substrate-binding protein [Fluviispira sanaruensis]|uniref:Peptide ABC transporter substrate-binding protein n=1 Tax=Fluviispira sanaruensis TaxID=2493639 RepID=A0A4P2VLG4_FLUSA|nr:peptide ABC transporter substrate-binding protein [Fluviispira sanaruensis]BBH52804.1 peptide ABC transporter substrate-binding protein [Fluviispira sanaruensis]
MKKYYKISAIVTLLSSIACANGLKDPLAAKVQEIHIGNFDNPKSLDPALCNEQVCDLILIQLFEGLVKENNAGDIEPAAAEKWVISDDGKTYTFTLRNNLKWSDGSKLVAQDYVYAMKRLIDPKNASEFSNILESVVNGKGIISGQKNPKTLGVRALNDTTLEIKLAQPTSYFLQYMIMHQVFPMQKKSVEQHANKGSSFAVPGKLISNGPFILTSHKIGNKLTIEKNPNYWDKESVYLNKVHFYPIVDSNTEYKMYETGQLDITAGIPTGQYKILKNKHKNDFKSTPILANYYYIFNLSNEKLKSKNLRTALSIVLDRDVITQNILEGSQRSLYDFVPFGIKDYTQAKTYWQDYPREKQLAEARKLYAEAGYSKENPFKINITYNTNDGHKKIATAIASMWKKELGVLANIQNEEWKSLLEKRINGDFELVRYSYIADINDPINFLIQFRTKELQNDARYSNNEYDKLINESMSEMDPVKRKNLLKLAGKIIIEDSPVIPIYSMTTSYLLKPSVVNLEKNMMLRFYLKNTYIREQGKAIN